MPKNPWKLTCLILNRRRSIGNLLPLPPPLPLLEQLLLRQELLCPVMIRLHIHQPYQKFHNLKNKTLVIKINIVTIMLTRENVTSRTGRETNANSFIAKHQCVDQEPAVADQNVCFHIQK